MTEIKFLLQIALWIVSLTLGSVGVLALYFSFSAPDLGGYAFIFLATASAIVLFSGPASGSPSGAP